MCVLMQVHVNTRVCPPIPPSLLSSRRILKINVAVTGSSPEAILQQCVFPVAWVLENTPECPLGHGSICGEITFPEVRICAGQAALFSTEELPAPPSSALPRERAVCWLVLAGAQGLTGEILQASSAAWPEHSLPIVILQISSLIQHPPSVVGQLGTPGCICWLESWEEP